jgi:hypothetical protein
MESDGKKEKHGTLQQQEHISFKKGADKLDTEKDGYSIK